MTISQLPMPQYVSDLLVLPLFKLGLQPISTEDEVVSCNLQFEDGSEIGLLIMCASQTRFTLLKKAVLIVCLATLDVNGKLQKMFSKEFIDMPKHKHDMEFALKLGWQVRAAVANIGAEHGMGECVSLPRRSDI